MSNIATPLQAASFLRFVDHRQLGTHTNIHTVGLLRTTGQLVAEGATYVTHDKHKAGKVRRT